MIVVYGLKNCDTCRKARKWLEAEGLEHQFKDVRDNALDEGAIARWIASAGWEILLNRRGTTWRNLPDTEKHELDTEKAQSLMTLHPALIKRPVFETGKAVLVGFKEDVQAELKG